MSAVSIDAGVQEGAPSGRIEALRAAVERGEYAIDVRAVAEAIVEQDAAYIEH